MNIFEITKKIRETQSEINLDSTNYYTKMAEYNEELAKLYDQFAEEIENAPFPDLKFIEQHRNNAKEHRKLAQDSRNMILLYSTMPGYISNTGNNN
jgi:ligand-binding SRPBCC domain-containing protein